MAREIIAGLRSALGKLVQLIKWTTKRKPAPRTHTFVASGGIRFGGSARVEHRKAKLSGKKKPRYEHLHSPETSTNGERVIRTRVIDRENDRYFEEVRGEHTGKLIHTCDEPLSDHVGHGSAKKRDC